MAYYSLYRILKDIIYTFIRLLKKSSLKIITIIIVFLSVFLLFNYSNADYISDNLNPYDNILNNNSVIKNIYDYYKEHWNYTGLSIFRANNDYMACFYDYTCFKQYISTNSIYLKNITNDTNSLISVNFFDSSGYFLSNYSTITSRPNNTTELQSVSLFAYSDIPVFENISSEVVWYPDGYITLPYFETETTTIENWTFDYLSINGGTISPYFELNNNNYPYLFDLKIIYNNTTYYLDIQDYVTINQNTNTFNISIPKDYLTTSFNVAENCNFSFTLELNSFDINGDINNTTYFDLGSYSFILTTAQVQEQNNNSQRFLENQNNNNLNNINNSLNNSNINSNNIDSFNDIDNNLNINDTTNIDTIFNNIYNAFVTKYNDNNIGYGYTLSLPIPFTDKTLDISPHTLYGRSTYDLYQPENQYDIPAIQVIYTFVKAIWYFVIGAFILKDIRNMINKIAEGNIENVGSDVKKEML